MRAYVKASVHFAKTLNICTIQVLLRDHDSNILQFHSFPFVLLKKRKIATAKICSIHRTYILQSGYLPAPLKMCFCNTFGAIRAVLSSKIKRNLWLNAWIRKEVLWKCFPVCKKEYINQFSWFFLFSSHTYK